MSSHRLRSVSQRLGGRQVLWGAAVLTVVVIALVATIVVYLNPGGRQTVVFETDDAASVSAGTDVRIAGISVGQVTDVSMQAQSVRIETEIDDTAFVGDRSSVEVRMLTPVGGYFVTIVSAGDAPLGDQAVPMDRVKMPYSIADVLQAAPHVTDNVRGTTVDADFAQLADGLSSNSESVGALVSGLDSVATVMADQREQVRRTLDLASEYLNTFNENRDFIFGMLQRVETVLATYYTYRDGFNETYELLGDALIRLIPVENFYLDNKEVVLGAITQLRNTFADLRNSIDPVVDQLSVVREQLDTLLTPDGLAELGGGTLLASNICVPIPGREC